MAYTNGPPKIVTDGLVLYTDTMNYKSYSSGSLVILDVASGVSASINRLFRTTASYANNPLITTSSVTGQTAVLFENEVSRPEVYFTNRSSRFTFSVWASIQQINAFLSGNSSQGIFSRGSFQGYVGIHATRANTGSATSVSVGTRGIGNTRTVILTGSIGTGSVEDAQIFNAVLVYDSSSIYGYLNGEYKGAVSSSVETTEFTGSSYAYNTAGGIGGNSGACTMSIYNSSIYNRALTAQEVEQNFNAMRGRYGV